MHEVFLYRDIHNNVVYIGKSTIGKPFGVIKRARFKKRVEAEYGPLTEEVVQYFDSETKAQSLVHTLHRKYPTTKLFKVRQPSTKKAQQRIYEFENIRRAKVTFGNGYPENCFVILKDDKVIRVKP